MKAKILLCSMLILGSLLIALYITQDSFGTAINVSGDNAIAIYVDEFYKKYIKKSA